MQTKLTINFRDSVDRENFLRYASRAQGQDGTVGGLYAGLMCCAIKRATVESPNGNARTPAEAVREIGAGAGEVLATKAAQILSNLTADEIKRFSHNGEFPYRIAKLLIVASQDEVTRQYSAEGFKSELRSLKRIRASRYL